MTESISQQIKEIKQTLEVLITKLTTKQPNELNVKIHEILPECKLECLDERTNHVLHSENGQLNIILDLVYNIYQKMQKDITNLENKNYQLTKQNEELESKIKDAQLRVPLTLEDLKQYCETTKVKIEINKVQQPKKSMKFLFEDKLNEFG